MPSSKTRTLKVNAHVIGCVKRYLNKKGVIIEVVTEGTKTQFLVRFDEESQPQLVTARAIMLDSAFVSPSPQQVRQAFVAAGGGDSGLQAAIAMGAVPVFSTIANPNQEIQQQREPTENQAVSSNAEEQVDDEDSDVEESNHPAFGDIPDNSIPGLLGHPASETPLQRLAYVMECHDEIQSCLQFGTFSDEQLLENPWLPVQCFIDGFNATRVKYVNPGTYLLIDEIMSPWLGLDADYAMNGVPHRTKIERKPKGIGVELKAVCDCMSSIMMQLEICEGALRQSQKKYEDQYGSGTAVTLRMTSSWHGKAHIVVGDSAFSSVATAVALKQNGTYFVGIVKTASKMYPKQFMQTHHFEELGAHIALSATVQCNKVFAVSWLDGKRKDLVSTCGTTLPASPAQRTRQQVVVSSTSGVKTRPYICYTPRCNIVASFFDNFHKIDVHDHLRQGVLKLEQHWLTKNWVHRLFATLIGVVATDCYFASKLLYPHQMSEPPFLQYIDKLAFQLINNELYSGRCTRSSTGSEASSIIRPAIHTLKPIHTLPEYSKKQNEKRRMSTENLGGSIPNHTDDITIWIDMRTAVKVTWLRGLTYLKDVAEASRFNIL
eukprot:Em0003g570a